MTVWLLLFLKLLVYVTHLSFAWTKYFEVLICQLRTQERMISRRLSKCYTVEPRFNEPLVNESLDITNDIICPGQSYSKMYGIEGI